MTTEDDCLVRVSKVDKAFRRGPDVVHVLEGLNLEVKRGEFLALMGPSGSGKSTLLNLLGGLDRPEEGTVEIGGDRVNQLSDNKLAAWRARHIGFIFQFYNLLPVLTAERNAEQSQLVYRLITGLGTLIAALMGIGALFGALNTMYNAVAARTREIATLRALGFGGGPVILSVLIESLFLAALGGAIGAAAAWFLFDGYRAATINWQSFSQVTFAFAVTPSLLIQGILYALLIGLFGGLFPALRAARLPIAIALREN